MKLPLSESLDIAGDLMAANILSQEAQLSTSSHISNILLQHRLKFVGHSASMVFSSPMGRPSNVPITLHSAAYLGVMCS